MSTVTNDVNDVNGNDVNGNDDDDYVNIADMSDDERNEELLECARYGEDELLQLLLSSGADVNYSDDGGSTAVHKAAANGQLQCLHILIKAGALHKANGQGNYPIHWAAQNGQADTLKLLLDSYPDADVLAQNSNGISTLTEAFNSKKQGTDYIYITSLYYLVAYYDHYRNTRALFVSFFG